MGTLEVAKPLFLLSKCLGLAPFSVINTGDSSTLQVSRAAVIYSTGILILISAFLIDRLSLLNNFHKYTWPLSLAYIAFQLSTTLFTYWGSYISCTVNYSNTTEVLNRIFMSVSWCKIFPHRYKLFSSIIVFQIFGGLLLVGMIYSIEWLYDLHSYFSEMVPYIITDYCDYVYELQFIDLVLLLGYYFDTVNSRVIKLCEESEEFISVRRNTLFSISQYGISYEMNSKTLSRAKIHELTRLHDSLCDTAELVNRIYSFMMLIDSASTFTGITYGLYIASITIFDTINVHEKELNPLLPTLSWSFFYAMMLVCVVSSCSSTSYKVRKFLGSISYFIF
jgi:hypothetical protein